LEERLEVDRSLNLNMASHIALTREVAQAGREINEAMVVMRKVLYPLTVLGRFFSLVGDVLTKIGGGSFGGLLHRGRRSDG
jgi:hypothetical protein